MALHLPVDVEGIRRAIDVAVLDINPGAGEQSAEILRRRDFFGCRNLDAAQNNG
jgi:hypothetical protein